MPPWHRRLLLLLPKARSSREVLGIAQFAGSVGKGKFASISRDASDP